MNILVIAFMMIIVASFILSMYIFFTDAIKQIAYVTFLNDIFVIGQLIMSIVMAMTTLLIFVVYPIEVKYEDPEKAKMKMDARRVVPIQDLLKVQVERIGTRTKTTHKPTGKPKFKSSNKKIPPFPKELKRYGWIEYPRYDIAPAGSRGMSKNGVYLF